jgi:hypothetical protein
MRSIQLAKLFNPYWPTLSYAWQCILLYQGECRAHFDALFLLGVCWFPWSSANSWLLFWHWSLGIFGKINLGWLLELTEWFGKQGVKKIMSRSIHAITSIAPYCTASLHKLWKIMEVYYIFWTFFNVGNISHISVIVAIRNSMLKAYSVLWSLVLTLL